MIDRAENLLPRLMPAGIEHHELVSILRAHFGSSIQDSKKRLILFPNRPPHALRLVYNKNLQITGAFADEKLTQKDIETTLAELNRNYLDSAGTGVAQRVLLVSGPMDGWWRYRDRFQIVPVPPDAPRPGFLIGAYPFLLESTYNKSPDNLIDSLRRERVGFRISLVLSSLLRRSITWHLPTAVGNRNHAWVQLPNSGHQPNVAYCTITYDHPSIRHIVDAFSPTDSLPSIPLVAAENYYKPGYFHRGDGLELPDDLEESFDLFFFLSPQRQDRFVQASYWFNQAKRVDSFSSMFLYTIQAIESLAWRPRSQSECPTCKRTVGPGPTRLFREFLDRFAPEAREGSDTLYTVRSGLSHGSIPPFLVDTEFHFGYLPEGYGQWQLVGDAFDAARIAMRNWLRNPCESQSTAV